MFQIGLFHWLLGGKKKRKAPPMLYSKFKIKLKSGVCFGLVLEFSATFVGFQCGCVLCLHLAYSLFSGFDVNPLYGEKGKQCF